MVRRLLLSVPAVALKTRIAVELPLRERGWSAPETAPPEAMALTEPMKHGIPRQRLVSHLEALNFIQACIKCNTVGIAGTGGVYGMPSVTAKRPH